MLILRSYLQDGDRYKFEHENPFLDEDEKDEVAPVGYRYRKWSLGNDVQLVARTEHDAVQLGPNNELQFINLKVNFIAFNKQFKFTSFKI